MSSTFLMHFLNYKIKMENYLPSDVKLLLNVSKLYVFLFSSICYTLLQMYSQSFAAHAKAGAKDFKNTSK